MPRRVAFDGSRFGVRYLGRGSDCNSASEDLSRRKCSSKVELSLIWDELHKGSKCATIRGLLDFLGPLRDQKSCC